MDLRVPEARDAVAESPSGLAAWYEEACQDLAEVHLEAAEEGLDAPDPTTIEDTRRMLKLLAEDYDQLPYVQAMRDGRIGIKFENREGQSSVFIVMEHGGSGVLFACLKEVSQRNRVSDVFKILSLGGRQALDQAGIRRRPLQPADASSTAPRSRSDPSASG